MKQRSTVSHSIAQRNALYLQLSIGVTVNLVFKEWRKKLVGPHKQGVFIKLKGDNIMEKEKERERESG